MAETFNKFEVFFDGQCPLCSREIDMIRRKDKSNQLTLTDISAPGFSSDDFSQEALMKEIHGRLPNGEYVKGVEVFREIYHRLGFARVVASTRLPGIRHFLSIAYRCFAFFRFKHAMHRIAKSDRQNPTKRCATGVCQPIESSAEEVSR